MTINTVSRADRIPSLVLVDSISSAPLVATGSSLTNANPMHVAVVDSTGSQITASSPLPTSDSTNQSLIQSLLDLIGVLKDAQRAVPYARDVAQQMRVVVSGVVTANASTQWGAANVYPTYYAAGSPGAMDTREMQSEVAEMKFNAARMGRWVIT